MFVVQKGLHNLENRTIASLLIQRFGNSWNNQLWVMYCGQGDEIDPIGKRFLQIVSDRERQTRFADPSWSGQGQQTHFWLPESHHDRLVWSIAPNKLSEGVRQLRASDGGLFCCGKESWSG